MLRLLLTVLFLLPVSAAFAWIPPAKLVLDCAEGKDPVWPMNPMEEGKGMGHGTRATKDYCRKLVVDEARHADDPANDPKDWLCIPKEMSDEDLYKKILRYFTDHYAQGTDKTYIDIVRETLWDRFACSDETRAAHFKEEGDARNRAELWNAAQQDFNTMAYGELAGKDFCVPRKGGEYAVLLGHYHIMTLSQWRSFDLHAALENDYPCRK